MAAVLPTVDKKCDHGNTPGYCGLKTTAKTNNLKSEDFKR